MKLCVFPNDPIISYYEKGEIKERYFNPNNIFDEINIISFTKKDVEESKVQVMAGNAKLRIHSVGKVNFLKKNTKKNEIIKLVKKLGPDVIRAYNPLIAGWMAAYCSKKLNIPLFVSLHIQYDGLRKLIKTKNYKKYLALKYSRKKIEPYVLSNANKITSVYKIIEPYVVELSGKYPEILYNRVDLKRFKGGKKIKNFDKPLILSVGRLTPQKNPDLLIKAIKDLDVYLQLIGDGELKKSLMNLVKKLGIEKKVIFTLSVPNIQIQDYYKSADLFALPYDPQVEGLPIPVLEAMAAGLPVIIPHPMKDLSDGLENSVAFADLEIDSFSSKIKKILEDKKYAQSLSNKAIEKSMEFDGVKMENREAKIYEELMGPKN